MRTALNRSGETSLSASLIWTKVAPQTSVVRISRMCALKERDTGLRYQFGFGLGKESRRENEESRPPGLHSSFLIFHSQKALRSKRQNAQAVATKAKTAVDQNGNQSVMGWLWL